MKRRHHFRVDSRDVATPYPPVVNDLSEEAAAGACNQIRAGLLLAEYVLQEGDTIAVGVAYREMVSEKSWQPRAFGIVYTADEWLAIER